MARQFMETYLKVFSEAHSSTQGPQAGSAQLADIPGLQHPQRGHAPVESSSSRLREQRRRSRSPGHAAQTSYRLRNASKKWVKDPVADHEADELGELGLSESLEIPVQEQIVQDRHDREYLADTEDSEDEYGNPSIFDHLPVKTAHGPKNCAAIADQVNISTVSCDLSTQIGMVESAAQGGDALAITLIEVIGHYRSVAADEMTPISDIAIAFRNSTAELTLAEALTLYGSHDNDGLADNLVSTLLANEEPQGTTSALAPVYSTARWLNCEKDLQSRVVDILSDICKALNTRPTDQIKPPFHHVGVAGITRRIVFLYKPIKTGWVMVDVSYTSPTVNHQRIKLGKVSIFDPLNSGTDGVVHQTALQELIPLLTLARLHNSSPFNGVSWTEESISMEISPRQVDSNIDSGPISILAAVYRANQAPLPLGSPSAAVQRGLGWRIRLACARRLSLFVQEQQLQPFKDKNLFSLLQIHTSSVTQTVATQSLPGRRVTQAEKQNELAKSTSMTSTGGSSMLKAPRSAKGYQPYRLKDRYYCPFKKSFNGFAPCDKYFTTSHGRSAHVMNVHARQGIPFPDDSSEDGTEKISCPNKCGHVFRSYKKAKEHTSRDCKKRPTGDVQCPWFSITGCPKYFKLSGIANHIRTHFKDERGPYQCHLCPQYFADRYTLGAHVDDCTGQGAKPRANQMVRLLLSEKPGQPPRIILIVRSSAEAPVEWKMNKNDLETGLLAYGVQILQQVRRVFDVRAAGVLHAGWNMKTRELPAPEEYSNRFDGTDQHRVQKNNACKWTKAINEDILKAEKPIIITLGWDGWSCSTTLLSSWLKIMPDMRWIFRIPNLHYDADQGLLHQDENVFWAEFHSAAIVKALENPADCSKELRQLVRIWDHIQGSKDVRQGKNALFNGRNVLNIDTVHSDISTDEEA